MQHYSLFYLKTALHVSGGTTTHHQERKQLYLQHLVFCHTVIAICRYRRSVECAVGGVRHPQHTQTSSNSSTIAADSNNGVTKYQMLFALLMMGDDTTRNM